MIGGMIHPNLESLEMDLVIMPSKIFSKKWWHLPILRVAGLYSA